MNNAEYLKCDNKVFRRLLWLNHGCSIVALYGDDGEMQCSSGKHQPIDFVRDTAITIENKLGNR